LGKPLLNGLDGPQSLFSEPIGPTEIMGFDTDSTGRWRSQGEKLRAIVARGNYSTTYSVQKRSDLGTIESVLHPGILPSLRLTPNRMNLHHFG